MNTACNKLEVCYSEYIDEATTKGNKMNTKYEAVKGANGYTVYGPCGSVMRADANKAVTYSNIVKDSGPYKKLLKALRAA